MRLHLKHLYLFKGSQKRKVFIKKPLCIRSTSVRLVLPQGHNGSATRGGVALSVDIINHWFIVKHYLAYSQTNGL
jgi:hypothetical protein